MKRFTFYFICLLLSLLSCRRMRSNSNFDFTGTVELTEHGIGVPVMGRIKTLSVDEGDRVTIGQLIATTDRYDQNTRDYQRLSQLLTHGGTNEQEVENAGLAMEDQKVLSPVNGVVLTKVHDTGEVVDAKSPIVIVGDNSRLWIKIYIPEGQINLVKMDQTATIHFDGLTKTYQGHISYISPQAEFTPRNVQTPEERVTQTFAVKVTVDDVEPHLRPGVSADVTLRLQEGKP